MTSANSWAGCRALITGGLGFIGSNLAIRLAHLGARVTLVDAMIPEYGGNLFNIEPVRDRLAVNFGDVCDRLAMNWLVKDQDYVFHLAGSGVARDEHDRPVRGHRVQHQGDGGRHGGGPAP
jgi:UDP-glucose 4-epimerase